MENAPVIHIAARMFRPGEEDRYNDFLEKWYFEAYVPLIAQNPGFQGAGRYRILNETPDYPKYMMIFHFTNLAAFRNYDQSSEAAGIREATGANFPTSFFRWFVQYQIVNRWGNEPERPPKDTKTEFAPVIHLEGFILSLEEEEKYNDWFATKGHGMYLQLVTNGEGVTRIEHCRVVRPGPLYPLYMTFFSFGSIKAFADWEKNREVATIREDIKSTFPSAQSWHVQYELTKSWRK